MRLSVKNFMHYVELRVMSLGKYRIFTCMLYSKTLNDKINLFHEQALSIVYSDYSSALNTLFEKNGFFLSIIEVFKL